MADTRNVRKPLENWRRRIVEAILSNNYLPRILIKKDIFRIWLIPETCSNYWKIREGK